jgi:hypothetical protein
VTGLAVRCLVVGGLAGPIAVARLCWSRVVRRRGARLVGQLVAGSRPGDAGVALVLGAGGEFVGVRCTVDDGRDLSPLPRSSTASVFAGAEGAGFQVACPDGLAAGPRGRPLADSSPWVLVQGGVGR